MLYHREIIKIKTGCWTIISDAPDEASYRYSSRKNAQIALDKLIKIEQQGIDIKKEMAVARFERVLNYLIQRNSRQKVEQFSFNF